MAAALEGLPFRRDAFQPFLDDVAASRDLPPVRREDVKSPMIASRLNALLLERHGEWLGLMVPTTVKDLPRVQAALEEAGVTWINVGAEANAIVAKYTRTAWRWLAYGAIAALATLLLGLRDPIRVARVVGSVAGAALVTVAALTALGARLSIINIVALQFVAGVGLDYALFFARRQLDEEERARTLRTLSICNAMAVLTFGLLAFCRTPLLRQIGLTVVIGAVSAICFAFLFAGPKARGAPREAG